MRSLPNPLHSDFLKTKWKKTLQDFKIPNLNQRNVQTFHWDMKHLSNPLCSVFLKTEVNVKNFKIVYTHFIPWLQIHNLYMCERVGHFRHSEKYHLFNVKLYFD